MTRPGLVVDSHRRPLSWVIVAASFLAYLGLLVAVGIAGLHVAVPLPWWLAQTAPPLLYALLVLVVVRRCPFWWPAWITTLANQRGVVAELHDSILDGNQA